MTVSIHQSSQFSEHNLSQKNRWDLSRSKLPQRYIGVQIYRGDSQEFKRARDFLSQYRFCKGTKLDSCIGMVYFKNLEFVLIVFFQNEAHF